MTAPPPLYGADSMLFIYHFESNAEFGGAAAGLLRRTEEGNCRLVCTTLALLEVLVVPKRLERFDLCRQYRELFDSFPNLRMQPVDEGIAEIASDLRARYKVKTPDAIHIAGAIAAGADAFLSQDGDLKAVREIPVLSLGEVP